MNNTPEKNEYEQDVSKLVDEVMRGERQIWFPPGTLIVSFLIPFTGCATVMLGFMLAANFFPLQSDAVGIEKITYPIGIGLVLMAIGFVMFALTIQGHIKYGRRILNYVRSLLIV